MIGQMVSKATARSASLESRRVQLERPVRLRFPHFETFVSEFSKNVSLTGMFVASPEPKPPGTVFDFDFRVSDDWELIHGRAQVVWSRERQEGNDDPPGMGVRFVKLDPQSRRLIRWLVERQLISGESSFDLGPVPRELDRSLPSEPARRDRVVQSRFSGGGGLGRRATARDVVRYRASRRRRRRLWIGLALLALLLGAAGWFRYAGLGFGPFGGSRSDPSPAPAAPIEQEAEGPSAPDSLAGAGPETFSRVIGEQEIDAMIRSWARSWSDQRLDDYLGHYAADFQPLEGLTREQWRALRSERLTTPLYIRVALTALEIEWLSEDRVEARFFQSYRSDRYSDTVRKSLLLQRRQGEWKILSETVLP